MQFVHLCAQMCHVTIVVNDVVGQRQALLPGNLCRHDAAHRGLGKLAALHGATDLQGFVAVDDQHALDQVAIATCLEKQGHNQQHIGSGRERGAAAGFSADQRMQDIFQLLA